MTKYLCDACHVFACPIVIKSKTLVYGCDIGEDLMNQIKAGMKNKKKNKSFEDVCKELEI